MKLKEWAIEVAIEGMATDDLGKAVDCYSELISAGCYILADLVLRSIKKRAREKASQERRRQKAALRRLKRW